MIKVYPGATLTFNGVPLTVTDVRFDERPRRRRKKLRPPRAFSCSFTLTIEPPVPEPFDWRPAETIPEDFYAL